MRLIPRDFFSCLVYKTVGVCSVLAGFALMANLGMVGGVA